MGIEDRFRVAASFTTHTSWPAPTDKTCWGLTVAICWSRFSGAGARHRQYSELGMDWVSPEVQRSWSPIHCVTRSWSSAFRALSIPRENRLANPIMVSERTGTRKLIVHSLSMARVSVDIGKGNTVTRLKHISESTERWALTTLGACLLLLCLGPAVRSPDGMEMLRLSASWLGADVSVGDPGFWPPLWPLLNVPTVHLGMPFEGARLVNLLCLGLLIWPLHMLATCLGGRKAGRMAVVLYLLLPTISSVGSVMDARPLGALLTTGFAAAAVHAAKRGSGWQWMLVFAALAPLARPEGVLLPLVAGVVLWLIGRPMWHGLIGGLGALLPHVALSSAVRGLSGHEQLFAPWYGTWATWDLLSLFGPASVPTEFRRFALAAVDAGAVHSQPGFDDALSVLATFPGGIMGGMPVLAGALGITGLLAIARGLWMVLPRRRRWVCLGLTLMPFLAVAGAPMAAGQGSPLANFLFVLPGFIALAAVGMSSVVSSWPSWVGFAAAILMVVEVHLTPLRGPDTHFIEGSHAADLATGMLQKSPPKSGIVAVDFSGRDVAFAAGLQTVALGPPWAGPVPERVDAILISSVGASGEDGGRTLRLLESPDWRVEWVVGDGDMATSVGLEPETERFDRGWYALLVRR